MGWSVQFMRESHESAFDTNFSTKIWHGKFFFSCEVLGLAQGLSCDE